LNHWLLLVTIIGYYCYNTIIIGYYYYYWLFIAAITGGKPYPLPQVVVSGKWRLGAFTFLAAVKDVSLNGFLSCF